MNSNLQKVEKVMDPFGEERYQANESIRDKIEEIEKAENNVKK